MNRILALPAVVTAAMALAACQPGSSVNSTSAGGIPMGDYVLVGIGADAVPTRNVRLNISPGAVSGEGPCNSYSGTLGAALPAFAVQQMNWTDEVCKRAIENRLEARYFEALTQATEVSYSGGVLQIKGPTYLTFEPGRPATQEELQAMAAAELERQQGGQQPEL